MVEASTPMVLEAVIKELELKHTGAASKHSDLQDAVGPLTIVVNTLAGVLQRAQQEVRDAERDAGKGGEVQSETDRVALAKAEQDVEDAREVVRLVKAEADAARLQQTIARYAVIARALGPEGVRAKMLAAGLTKLNAGLAVIAERCLVAPHDRGRQWRDRSCGQAHADV